MTKTKTNLPTSNGVPSPPKTRCQIKPSRSQTLKRNAEAEHDQIQTLLAEYLENLQDYSGLRHDDPYQYDPEFREFRSERRSEAKQIQESYEHFRTQPGSNCSPKQALSAAIRNPHAAQNSRACPWADNNCNTVDPVLSYCLAREASLPNTQTIFLSEAVASYSACYELYDRLLRDRIPSDLKAAAKEPIARRQYLEGTHATAVDDLSVLLQQAEEEAPPLPTGLRGLDDALGGGLSGLTIVGADEGKGKTSLLLYIVVAALRAIAQLDCMFLTIDQFKSATMWKLVSLVTGRDLKTLRQDETDRSSEANRRIKEGFAELRDDILPRMRFLERANLPREPLTAEWLVKRYRELRQKSKASQGLLVVDMFQSIDVFPETVRLGNDEDDFRLNLLRDFIEQSRCSSESCPGGFPVIASSEVRKTEKTELTANDLRGSARLGSVPNNIVLMWPSEDTDQHAVVVPRTVLVSKTRLGQNGLLHLNFNHPVCRFDEGGPPSPEGNGHSESPSKRPVGRDRCKDL